jgi:beta-glucosidase
VPDFNIMLAGGLNLARDVRNGRTFDCYGEDPYSVRSRT